MKSEPEDEQRLLAAASRSTVGSWRDRVRAGEIAEAVVEVGVERGRRSCAPQREPAPPITTITSSASVKFGVVTDGLAPLITIR